MEFLKRKWRAYLLGKSILEHPEFKRSDDLDKKERKKAPQRTEIINYLLSSFEGEINYLEIGVRNPDHNFNHIKANNKFGVDPGLSFKENPVEFKMTSDEFFDKLRKGEVLNKDFRFNAIFVDGLHLAEQVDRDIKNALEFLVDDGFIILHDCNPPTEWHAREEYDYYMTPAGTSWNGTTWKAFLKWRSNSDVQSCCIDTDWGVGIIAKKHPIGNAIPFENQFFEFQSLDPKKKDQLNLMSFDELKAILKF